MRVPRVGSTPSNSPGPSVPSGSELGPPRDLTAILPLQTSIQLAWLPPHPETSPVVAYRLRYSPSAGTYRPQEMILHGDEVGCAGYESRILTGEHLCTTATGLKPATTYRFAVQAQAASGNWGPFTSDHFATTIPEMREMGGGTLKLVGAGHDYLRVRWTPPSPVAPHIERYEVNLGFGELRTDQNDRK